MMLLAAVMFCTMNVKTAQAEEDEVRAVWVSFYEYKGAGLKNKPEGTFRVNADKMFRNIRDNGCNTVYFHVRAFDDAIWPSDNFEYIYGTGTGIRSAGDSYRDGSQIWVVVSCVDESVPDYPEENIRSL